MTIRLVWLLPLLFLVASVALLTRAVYLHRKNRIPLPASLLGGFALNTGLAFLIVPQFMELSSTLRWVTTAVCWMLLVYSFRLSRRALSGAQ